MSYNPKKNVLTVILIAFLCFIYAPPDVFYAHEKQEEHYKELEAVLFESGYPKYKSEDVKNYIQALEYASYLTIDQFSQNPDKPNGVVQFDALKALKMDGLPLFFQSIDLNKVIYENGTEKGAGGRNHRKYTHQGWEQQYEIKDVNTLIGKRRAILLGTVNSIFKFNKLPIIGKYDERCQSFAGIVYYIHILGDYDEANHLSSMEYLVHLAPSKFENPEENKEYMIPNLKKYIETLFPDQTTDSHYKDLMKELTYIEDAASTIESSSGGVDTEEEFEDYDNCAEDVMRALIKDMPYLLKNEEFFSNVFYAN